MTADEFAEHLKLLLPNLYDPACQINDAMASVLSPLAGKGEGDMRQAIIAQIEDLRPGPQIPQTARIRRLYQVLHLRYVEQWTQQRVADELGITVRHLAREQTRAIALLADRLVRATPFEQPPSAGDHSALHQSLASLELGGGGPAVSDLASAARRACQLVQVVAQARQVTVEVAPSEPGIMIAARPPVLAQILVHTLTQIISHLAGGGIVVDARQDASEGIFRVVAAHYAGDCPQEQDWSAELVQSQKGRLRFRRTEPGAEVEIAFPLASKHVVLVIDDNPDLIHYYRQCVANAPYELHGIAEGRAALQRAEELRPDIIVLDLMLPDVNGWDILEQLQAQETLREVPIIISSVISEEELALALGATLCLSKPVRRAAFVAALDAALARR